jgi:hypothetical protein
VGLQEANQGQPLHHGAEYTAASVMATEILGVRELLGELGVAHASPMSLRGDNQAVLKLLDGEGSSSMAKHIDVRIKYVGARSRSAGSSRPSTSRARKCRRTPLPRRSRREDWPTCGSSSVYTETTEVAAASVEKC